MLLKGPGELGSKHDCSAQHLRILLRLPGSSKLGLNCNQGLWLGSRETAVLLHGGIDLAPSPCHFLALQGW